MEVKEDMAEIPESQDPGQKKELEENERPRKDWLQSVRITSTTALTDGGKVLTCQSLAQSMSKPALGTLTKFFWSTQKMRVNFHPWVEL